MVEELAKLAILKKGKDWKTLTPAQQQAAVSQATDYITFIDQLNFDLIPKGKFQAQAISRQQKVEKLHELLIRVTKTLKGPACNIHSDLWKEIAMQVEE